MELYACGFNAHGQLNPDEAHLDSRDDVFEFHKAATAADLEVVFAGWSQTIGMTFLSTAPKATARAKSL